MERIYLGVVHCQRLQVRAVVLQLVHIFKELAPTQRARSSCCLRAGGGGVYYLSHVVL